MRWSDVQTVTVTFVELSIESSAQCDYDSVTLYDGRDPASSASLIGKYCGSRRPHPVTTSSSAVSVVFRSDFDVSTGRFALSWTVNQGRSVVAAH